MAIRDRFGRLLARVNALRPAVRARSAAARQTAIAEARLARFSGHAKQVADEERAARTAIARKREYERMFEDTRRSIRRDTAERVEEAQRELGDFRINIPQDELGYIPTEPAEGKQQQGNWISVSSSNVKAIRWVGSGPYPIECQFLTGWWYGYAGTFNDFLAFLNAPSKGRYVWYMRNEAKTPYVRYDPTTIPPKILYAWGHTGPAPFNRYESSSEWRRAPSEA